MKGVLGFFKKKWVIQLIGILALSALIWFIGPLIAVAGMTPLGSEWARMGTIAVLVVLWVIFRLWAELRAARREREFMDGLAQPGAEARGAEAQAADENVGLLAERFDQALQVLRETRKGKRGDQQHLYELPWYIIIGPPGSGKTTALLNSGLKFPLAERMGNQPIRGVSGTRNCEWLFTDEAVLIDTAGRYTTQESYQAVDAAEWNSFLGLLKRHRPRRPINGALVTLSLADLLQQTEEERALHAKAIRQRIQELYANLGIRFPIYMLLTKCDLVAGFTDFFADLSEEERAQVWGETFPAEGADGGEQPLARFAAGYDELLLRLQRLMPKRVQEERDVQRRSLILDYPQQMALLKPGLMAFLEEVFATSRYEAKPLLRGVYMTSGTQEGTPIDRIMGMLAGVYRLNRQSVPVYSGRGKSYFLTRLLREVIFPEAELAGIDPRVERRRRLTQAAAYGSVLLLVLGCIALWTVSYQRNRAALEEVRAQIDAYRAAQIDTSAWQANLRTMLPKLNALQAIRDIYADPGWTMHFGLYQGAKIDQAAAHAYEHWLRDYFLPFNVQRLAERISGPEGAKPELLYELLRVYLMFAQPERMQPKAAELWIRSDWEREFSAEPEVLSGLSLHLGNLLQRKLDPVPLNETLVASARARLSQVPQVIQIYTRFKNEAFTDSSHDFRLGPALGPQGARVFAAADGKEIATLGVPGLYTTWGYTDLFLNKSLDFVKESVTGNWVLGQQANLDLAEIERLHGDFKRLYLRDYQQAWTDLLTNIRLRRARDINQTIEWLDILSRPDNPVRPLLDAIDKNTSLSRLTALATQSLKQAPGAAAVLPDARTVQLLETARQLSGTGGGADPVQAVEAVFADLNYLVRGGGPDRPVPLDATLKTLGALHDYMLQVGGATASGGQALQSASGRLPGGGDVMFQAKTEFGRLPEPLKSWFLSLTDAGRSQSRSEINARAKGELTAMLQATVASPCKMAFVGRYPFVKGSPKEATLMDFAKFFAPNGVLDQFFQSNLKPFIDINRPVWAELSVDNQPLGLSPTMIGQFQNADRIRSAFFSGGGQTPAVAFQIKPLSLDDNVATFRLILEGQEVVYRHGPEQITALKWPGPSPGSGVRLVFETIEGRQISRSKDGAWAFFRLLDEAVLQKTGLPEKFNITFRAEGYSASYELLAASVNNPFGLPELRNFNCPDAM